MPRAHAGGGALTLFLTALGAAQPARADWQATRWNMTPEQVAQAMAGAAPIDRRQRGDAIGDKRVGNRGIHILGDVRLRAIYHYDAAGLALISLEGKGAIAARSSKASRTSMASRSGSATRSS